MFFVLSPFQPSQKNGILAARESGSANQKFTIFIAMISSRKFYGVFYEKIIFWFLSSSRNSTAGSTQIFCSFGVLVMHAKIFYSLTMSHHPNEPLDEMLASMRVDKGTAVGTAL
jgi:hypothetical protein